MKTLPSVIAFFLVYYVLWLVSMPLRIIQLFIQAMAGEEE
jgi:bacteriorhodopsin